MDSSPTIFLPKDAKAAIASAKASHGSLQLTRVSGDDFYVITMVETARDYRVGVPADPRYAVLRWDGSQHEGQWLRSDRPDLAASHLYLARRPETRIPWDAFKEHIPTLNDPGKETGLLIVHDPDVPDELRQLGAPEFAGWSITRDGVTPLHVTVEPADLGIAQLQDQWPVEALTTRSALVVGCGSIGGAAAETLARYGLGRVSLVDPDRFLWHNVVRHVLPDKFVGRRKVDALKEHLGEQWPNQTLTTYPLDVVEDAHLIRPLLDGIDVVVCAADGIAPRRVVSHLARRAGKPAVLACVLHSGAIGEVLRLRPTPRFGCLACQRAHLKEIGLL